MARGDARLLPEETWAAAIIRRLHQQRSLSLWPARSSSAWPCTAANTAANTAAAAEPAEREELDEQR